MLKFGHFDKLLVRAYVVVAFLEGNVSITLNLHIFFFFWFGILFLECYTTDTLTKVSTGKKTENKLNISQDGDGWISRDIFMQWTIIQLLKIS